MALTVDTRSVQGQARQHSTMDREVPWTGKFLMEQPLAKELLASDGCLERENQFTLGTCSLKGCLCSSKWPCSSAILAAVSVFS